MKHIFTHVNTTLYFPQTRLQNIHNWITL